MGLQEKHVAIMGKLRHFQYDKKNSTQGYGYISAAAMIGELNKQLSEHGLTFYCAQEAVTNLLPFTNKSGGQMFLATVECTYILSDGTEKLYIGATGAGADNADKCISKASTMACKYAIAHTFCSSWSAEDPEGDESVDKATVHKDGDIPVTDPTPTKKHTPKNGAAKKAKAGAVDTLRSQINSASTRNELELLKPEIALLFESDKTAYEELKDLLVARRAAFVEA